MARPRRAREAERRAAEEALATYLDARPPGARFTATEVAELLVAFGESVANIDEILSLRIAQDAWKVSRRIVASATETGREADTGHTTTPASEV